MKNGKQPTFPIVNSEGFPSSPHALDVDSLIGLTKREYFAAMAMQGMADFSMTANEFDAGELAKRAVLQADALLKELEATA